MMKKLRFVGILFVLSMMGVHASDIDPKYASSDNCKSCHATIVKEWESSLHAKSHFTKNELIEKTIEYMSLKTTLMKDQIVLNCSECHNPRVSKSSLSLEELYSQAYGQDSGETSAMLNSKYAKDGVNCITCHNIDKIHETSSDEFRGKNIVDWTQSGVMTGPIGAVDSPYHKSEKREFFKQKPDQLCNVCHKSGESYYGVSTCGTAHEVSQSKTDKSCIECHMGQTQERFIVDNDLAKEKRESRSHLFAGVRNSDIVKEAIKMSATKSANTLKLTLENITAHKVPTGYADRLMYVSVDFLNASDAVLATKRYDLKATFGDKDGEETISQLAQQVLSDTRLKVNEKRVVDFAIAKGATKAKVTLQYKLISSKWAKELGIKDEKYLKTYTIEEKFLKL